MTRPCPRCKVRLRATKASYCRACSAEYEAERKAGLHQRGRLCGACGGHFESRGDTTLCPPCRKSYRERVCTKCSESFWSRGALLQCPACVRSYAREHGSDAKRIAARRDQRYGLKPGQYDQMMTDQNGCCASCRDPFGPDRSQWPCVDHDRTCCSWNARSNQPICGECVRGILCWSCNVMLGNAKDDLKRLLLGADYLERSRARSISPPKTRVDHTSFR